MTEAEWEQARCPKRLLKFLRGKISRRKRRLFAVACCQRVWPLMTDARSRRAVEVAEAFADGLVSEAKRREAAKAARTAWEAVWEASGHTAPYDRAVRHVALTAVTQPERGADATAWAAGYRQAGSPTFPVTPEWKRAWQQAYAAEAAIVCELLREIVGSPFRPVAFDLAWRTPTVVALAGAAYDVRVLSTGTLQPDYLAVLADALEDAGCSNSDILEHLQRPGLHVRGCWVIDTLLGRS